MLSLMHVLIRLCPVTGAHFERTGGPFLINLALFNFAGNWLQWLLQPNNVSNPRKMSNFQFPVTQAES